jgi:hypothetical protein
VDPIINPGKTPSQHVHSIHGGSSENLEVLIAVSLYIDLYTDFNPNYSFDNSRASNCTNCLVAQDLSNYWFPKLYFQDPKTKLFEPVSNGGLLVYYQNRGDDAARNGGKGIKVRKFS